MSEAALDNPGVDPGASGDGTDDQAKGPDLTIVDTKDKPVDPVAAPADWPADWRDKLAGADEKLKTRLGRFSSPVKIFEAWRAAEQKISQGLKPAAFDPKATPEAQAEWRQANGVPEAPEKYDTNVGEGVVWGEDDKPILDSFLKHAHSTNMPQAYAKESLAWYNKFQTEQAEQLAETDETQRRENTVALQAEWGNEFKANLSAVAGWLDSIDPGDKEAGKPSIADIVFGARAADGGKLGNNPTFLKMLVDAAKAVNPASVVMPGTATDSQQGIGDELAKIDKFRRENRKAYDKDEKMQARERQLIEAATKLGMKI